MKIGLFFGSFNPIHIGHLIIANSIIEKTDINKVWFVISPQNPFKSSKSLLHEFDRLDMVEAAISDNYDLKASDVEFNMPRPSYTIDTLAILASKYPQHNFRLIIGEDNLKRFHKWKNHEAILNFYGLEVYPRPNSEIPNYLKEHANVRMVEAPLLDISATYIRKAIRANQSVRYLVHDRVLDYIKGKNLYL